MELMSPVPISESMTNKDDNVYDSHEQDSDVLAFDK